MFTCIKKLIYIYKFVTIAYFYSYYSLQSNDKFI